MARLSHLNALQALEAALRLGTMKGAAQELGVTQAAVGQRIGMLEAYLGARLLVRGAAGVTPTDHALPIRDDLRDAFATLRAVAEELSLEREDKVRVRADPDWLDLWLTPRLERFSQTHPAVRLAVRPAGPAGGGAADVEVFFGVRTDSELLFADVMLPVAADDILARVACNPDKDQLENLPLLHLADGFGEVPEVGWPDWAERFGQRRTGAARGVQFDGVAPALRSTLADVGVMLCPLSLVMGLVQAGKLGLPYPRAAALPARNAYRMRILGRAGDRRNVRLFADWLADEAAETQGQIDSWRSGGRIGGGVAP